jgi:hypothetical protein
MSNEADPGVISDDEDEFKFEELSHKGSKSSLSVFQISLPTKNETRGQETEGEKKSNRWNTDMTSSDDWEKKLFGINSSPGPNNRSVTGISDELKQNAGPDSSVIKNNVFKVAQRYKSDVEPVRKPRLIHDKLIKSEQILKSHSMEDISLKAKPDEKNKEETPVQRYNILHV